jgi:uncharacterized membrane protein (UPF0127 family)
MFRYATALLTASIILTSCGSGGASSRPSASPSFDVATVLIETDDDPVLITAEVAQTPKQRAVGLMNRKSLSIDEGMLFIFFEESEGGFWMKDTLIPLSIAFFDQEGRILSILDMQPCRREPCKLYDPGVAYWGALEVNQGAFERWGVTEGDVVRTNQ